RQRRRSRTEGGTMRLTMRVTLLTILLGLLLSTVVALSVVNSYFFRSSVEDLTAQILDQAARGVDRQIEELLDVASDQGILSRELVQKGKPRADDFPALAAFWAETMRVHEEISNLYITLDENGHTVIVMRTPEGALIVQELTRDPGTQKLALKNYKLED